MDMTPIDPKQNPNALLSIRNIENVLISFENQRSRCIADAWIGHIETLTTLSIFQKIEAHTITASLQTVYGLLWKKINRIYKIELATWLPYPSDMNHKRSPYLQQNPDRMTATNCVVVTFEVIIKSGWIQCFNDAHTLRKNTISVN